MSSPREIQPVGTENLCHLGKYPTGNTDGSVRRLVSDKPGPGRVRPGGRDDLQLVGLKLIFPGRAWCHVAVQAVAPGARGKRTPHRTLNQAAPLRPLPDGVTHLGHARVLRRDRAGGVIHEYRLVA
jgi:hypothetical protein